MSKIPVALKKFLLRYLLVHLIVTGIFVWALATMVRNRMTDETRSKMTAIAEIIALHVSGLDDGYRDGNLPEYIAQLSETTRFRFTIISNDGMVIYDSETGNRDIGYHGNRPEVQLSKFGRPGFSERYSATLNQDMVFLALRHRCPNDEIGLIRVAAPAASTNQAIRSVQAYVWLFAVLVSLLTAPVMVMLISKTMQPLALFADAARKIGMGQYGSAPKLVDRSDEWGLLGEAFRRMQKELQSREGGMLENSARLEAVLSSMIEGVIAVDPEDTVMIANNAACRMLGVSQGEIVGRKLLEVVRIPQLAIAIEKTRNEQTFSKSEFQTLAPMRRAISARVSVLRKPDQEDAGTPGVTLVMQDITDLRQLENMRRDFVANVSHELKTPLASIMAYAETLKLGAINDTEKNLDFVDQIHFQANTLNQQIQDLLQLARVESGQEVWDFKDVDVNEVCKNSIRIFASQAQQQDIALETDLAEQLAIVHADNDGLLTIVNNLVSNAIHYTPEGGTVILRTKVNANEVAIEVTDTGIGIATEHHSRIFERFYRVDKARSRDKGGTGLGLAIVKHLVQAFGGTIDLSSRIGKGTTFQIRMANSALHQNRSTTESNTTVS